jgi:hypothetical protein
LLDFLAQIALDSSLNQLIQAAYWLWPVLEIIHFVGLSLLLGGLIVIDLRMAGHFRGFDLQATHKLLPLVFLGFGLNLVTGILFFYGDPMRYSINIGFQIKMILVIIAGLNALLYYWKVRPLLAGWDADTVPPAIARGVAYTSLLVWTGVLLCGRLIPYVGTG